MKKRAMVRAMCYRVNTTGKIYLAYISYESLEAVQAQAEKINAEQPEKLWNGDLAKCDERTYFATEQEKF